MIDMRELVHCEIHFPKHIADVEERPYGVLFYNEDNKSSYDSNHAVILDYNQNLNDVLEDIVSFYDAKGITPRIYSGFSDDGDELIKPYLDVHGFEYELFDNYFLEWMQPSTIQPNSKLTIKRMTQLDDQIHALIILEEQGEWTYKALERHIKKESCHFFAGFIDDEPVVMASLNVMDGLSRIDDVITHPSHRKNGYASTLIDYIINYHKEVSKNKLYLFASEENAIRVYQKAGFVKIPRRLKSWSAWK